MDYWIPIAINAVFSIAVFIGGTWIKSRLERSVQHSFDAKLEELRAILRNSEEVLKSDLRAKEAEFASLRDAILNGRANRQALLDKRRIESVERVWEAVQAFAPLSTVSAMMARVNFDVAAKEAPEKDNVRRFFEVIGKPANNLANIKNPALNEEPFVSPLAWAYLSAYQTIIIMACARAKALELGVDDASSLFQKQNMQKLLKEALPHQTEFIEKYDFEAYHFLLDELKGKLLDELRKVLEGKEDDTNSITRAAEIMAMVKNVEKVASEHAK